jgi:ABC-type multidrug transport system fused ATPase/permease subunit
MKEKIKEYIFDYKRKKGVYPSPRVISIGLEMNMEDVKQAFHDLRREGIIRVYPGEDGKVSSYYVPSGTLAQYETPIAPRTTYRKKSNTIKGVVVSVIVIMLIVAFGAMSVSTYFSLQWTSTFLPLWVAIILSSGIPVYISFAPEGALLLYETSTPNAKGKKRIPIIGKLLLFTAVLALFFSMSMTIIGQFNARSNLIEKREEKSKTQNDNFEKLELLKIEKLDIEKNKRYVEADIEEAQKQKRNFEIGSRERNNLEWKISSYKKSILEYERKLERNREAQFGLIDTGAKKADHRFNFYDWFSESFGPPAGIVEFVLYVIPALFCDIISPLGISLSIYLFMRFFKKDGER